MVQLAVASSQPRDRLLHAAVEHVLGQGIVNLSRREITVAIGTSHRMLIDHFGSREGLQVAVVREVERRDRESLGAVGSEAGCQVSSCPGVLGVCTLRTLVWRAWPHS